ncbi:MAG TPA: esterase-like activity of phytase family protein [Cyclobacteriaceae bacterium]|jgi:hypothetical protein|nr:esterase-like activity of phytase family protein [Cyclobacteriaceae bacterium]
MKRLTLFYLVLLSFSFARSGKTQTISKLKFINEFVVPFNRNFKSTTIGGLSGIDYDKDHDVFYVVSDDRSDINPVRFYTAKIHINEKGIDRVDFSDVHFLLQADGSNYPSFKVHPEGSVDPEDIRFNSKTNELYWSSEGERILNRQEPILIKTAILFSRLDGSNTGSLPLPENLTMQVKETGPRRNGGLEGISFNRDFTRLYAALEEPLYEDGPRAEVEKTSSWVRFFKYDMKTNQNTAQYAYGLEPVAFPPSPANAFKINGVSDILALDETHMVVVERSYSSGRLPCTIKVFLADFSSSNNVKDVSSLTLNPPTSPAIKRLILNMDDLGIHIDNVEGVTFGPPLANGHQTLLFVTDDNFQQKQKTQFLLFEIIP